MERIESLLSARSFLASQLIQGKNDPRVVEQESRELVDQLISKGKEIDYLMFENEGHDVLKYENRISCYNSNIDFFITHLSPTS